MRGVRFLSLRTTRTSCPTENAAGGLVTLVIDALIRRLPEILVVPPFASLAPTDTEFTTSMLLHARNKPLLPWSAVARENLRGGPALGTTNRVANGLDQETSENNRDAVFPLITKTLSRGYYLPEKGMHD